MNIDRPEILIVDDDPTVCELLKTILMRNNHIVYIAYDGSQALEILKVKPRICIVDTDVMMPKLSGLSLLKTIKSSWPHIEVLIHTRFASIEAAVEMLEAGATDLIGLPIQVGPYLFKIEQMLKKINSDKLLAHLTGRVFISYAREDKKPVEALYEKLSGSGYHPWMDTKDLLPGEQWENKISNAIENSSFFLACLSEHSINKRGMVQKELRKGLKVWENFTDKDIYLIPLRLQNISVPEQLKSFQWVDMFEEDGWGRLIAAITYGLKQRKT